MIQHKVTLVGEKLFSKSVSEWMKTVKLNEKYLSGYFDDGRTIWLAQESNLLVSNVQTGEMIAQFHFGNDFVIDCATPCILERNHLGLVLGISTVPKSLLGIQRSSKSMLCSFDVMANRVFSAIAVPYRVASLCVIGSDHNSRMEDILLCEELKNWKSIVAVGTVEGHVLLCDANLASRNFVSDPSRPTTIPTYRLNDNFSEGNGFIDLSDFLRCNDLPNKLYWSPDDNSNEIDTANIAVTSLSFIREADLLAIGFSFGGFVLFPLYELCPAYISPFEPNAAAVIGFASLEPDDDPRNALYVWVLRDRNACNLQSIDKGSDAPSLELHQLYFYERVLMPRYNRYKTLSQCSSRMNWVPDSCKKLLNFATIALWSNGTKSVEGDIPCLRNRTIMYFFWIHKSGALVGCLFDINAWYYAQMPADVFASKEYRVCPFLAWHRYEKSSKDLSNFPLICAPRQSSIIRFRQLPDSQFNYFASSYSLKVDMVTSKSIESLQVLDVQNTVLDDLEGQAMDSLLKATDVIPQLQHARLLSVSENVYEEDAGRQFIWTTMLEHGRLHFLNTWFFDASNEPALFEEFIEWTWSQAVRCKEKLDKICSLLFDGSTIGVPETEKQVFRKHAYSLKALLKLYAICRTRFGPDFYSARPNFIIRELALKDTCLYADMVLWFLDAGVLPEKLGFYSRHVLLEHHNNRAVSAKNNGRKLLIYDFVNDLKEHLDETPVEGLDVSFSYPLESLRHLLSIYLIPGVDAMTKHVFMFYALSDVAVASSDRTAEKIRTKFADTVVANVDPMLANFGSLVWYFDEGNDSIVSRYLMDALLKWPPSNILRSRYQELIKAMLSNGYTPSVSLSLILPTFSFNEPKRITNILRFPISANVNERYADKLGNPKDKRESIGTPVKRHATESLTEDLALSSAKKARFHSRRSLNTTSNEDETLYLEALEHFEEARSLLKVPDVASFNLHCEYEAPVSILKTNRVKKRIQGDETSSYFEKSIRFALPLRSMDLSDSAIATSESESPAKEQIPNSPPESPSDDGEIQFNYFRNRWSLVDVPSSPEFAEDNGNDK